MSDVEKKLIHQVLKNYLRYRFSFKINRWFIIGSLLLGFLYLLFDPKVLQVFSSTQVIGTLGILLSFNLIGMILGYKSFRWLDNQIRHGLENQLRSYDLTELTQRQQNLIQELLKIEQHWKTARARRDRKVEEIEKRFQNKIAKDKITN